MIVLQTRWNLNQLFFIVSILLVAGAAKGNATMIKAYLILNGIVILIILAGRVLAFSGVVKVGAGGVSNAFVKISQGTIGFGMAIWAELVAFGAHQEIKSGGGIHNTNVQIL